jgi:hypothetical protein
MAVTTGSLLPAGTRVRVRASDLPLDPGVRGRPGTVVTSNDYRPNMYAVLLDGDTDVRVFAPRELEITAARALAAPREAAKRLRALP